MIAAQLITLWFDTQLAGIKTADKYFNDVKILHDYADKPEKMHDQPNPILIVEASEETIKAVPKGPQPREAKPGREIYINGLIKVPPGTRPNDVLDLLVFDIRRALYPATKTLLNNSQIKSFNETQCRFIFPEKGAKTAKLLMRFNIEYVENYEVK